MTLQTRRFGQYPIGTIYWLKGNDPANTAFWTISDWYYLLVESYRNVLDEVRQRTVSIVGFLSEFSGDQIDLIEKGICNEDNWPTEFVRRCSCDNFCRSAERKRMKKHWFRLSIIAKEMWRAASEL